METRQPAVALTHFEAAVSADPGRRRARSNLASLLAMQGPFDEALQHFEILLVQDPNDADAHRSLGGLWATRGRWRQAIEALEHSLRLEPSARTQAMLQRARQSLGE